MRACQGGASPGIYCSHDNGRVYDNTRVKNDDNFTVESHRKLADMSNS